MKNFTCVECSYLYRPAFGEEEMGIPPGTSFESIAETFSCPVCEAGEDSFQPVIEPVNEPFDPEDPSEAESQHIAFYHWTPKGVIVRIGTEDVPHPDEESHFLEWIGLVDEDGEDIEIKIRPTGGTEILFEGFSEEDVFEVRVCCSTHGVWRWYPDPFIQAE